MFMKHGKLYRLVLTYTYKIDPDDLIFPRTASRIGAKFQVNVPPGPEPYNIPIGKCYPMLSGLWAKLASSRH